MVPRITEWVNRRQREFVLAVAVALVAVSSFNLGRFSASESHSVTVAPAGAAVRNDPEQPSQGSQTGDTRVVVSRSSSSKKYHYSWCAGAKQIKESNKVWFETATLAEAAGYTLAGNCR